jgi:membrane-bound serine protease (ClpP class)
MKRVLVLVFLLLLLFSSSLSPAEVERKVYLIPIKEVIDLGLVPFVKRVLSRAEKEGAEAVIMEVNTLGGRLDAAIQIRDSLLDSKILTVAFINKRAISAGALISLAAKKIIMAPGATIGAAEPVTMGQGETKVASEKVISYVRKEMKATAEKNKRPVNIAEAMVDPDVEIKGVVEKGKLLTLTTEEALKLKLVDKKALDLKEVLLFLHLQGVKIEEISPNWAERIVRFLSHPIFSSLLLTLGMLGLIMEFRTFGITSLALFFWGHYIAGRAGWEELLLFLLGIGLLTAEIFFIPGFGIAGISGIILILVSLVLALVGRHFFLPDLGGAILRVAYVLSATLVISLLLLKFAPRALFWGKLTLATKETEELGFQAFGDLREYEGKTGFSETLLRPSGRAIIEGKRMDVLTEGGFIKKNKKIRVVKVEGGKIIVREIEDA